MKRYRESMLRAMSEFHNGTRWATIEERRQIIRLFELYLEGKTKFTRSAEVFIRCMASDPVLVKSEERFLKKLAAKYL